MNLLFFLGGGGVVDASLEFGLFVHKLESKGDIQNNAGREVFSNF